MGHLPFARSDSRPTASGVVPPPPPPPFLPFFFFFCPSPWGLMFYPLTFGIQEFVAFLLPPIPSPLCAIFPPRNIPLRCPFFPANPPGQNWKSSVFSASWPGVYLFSFFAANVPFYFTHRLFTGSRQEGALLFFSSYIFRPPHFFPPQGKGGGCSFSPLFE